MEIKGKRGFTQPWQINQQELLPVTDSGVSNRENSFSHRLDYYVIQILYNPPQSIDIFAVERTAHSAFKNTFNICLRECTVDFIFISVDILFC